MRVSRPLKSIASTVIVWKVQKKISTIPIWRLKKKNFGKLGTLNFKVKGIDTIKHY